MQKTHQDRKWLAIAASSVFVIAVILVQIIFFQGDYIWWISYQPLSPLSWDQIGTVTFRTLGALLYGTGFYLALYRGMKALGFTFADYKYVKLFVWLSLMVIVDWIQRFVVYGFNELWSLYWNVIRLIVFLFPSYCIIILGFLAFFLVRRALKRKI